MTQNNHMQTLLDFAETLECNAGAVMFKLINAIRLIIIANYNTNECIYCGLSEGEHKVICPMNIAQRALTAAVARIRGEDDTTND